MSFFVIKKLKHHHFHFSHSKLSSYISPSILSIVHHHLQIISPSIPPPHHHTHLNQTHPTYSGQWSLFIVHYNLGVKRRKVGFFPPKLGKQANNTFCLQPCAGRIIPHVRAYEKVVRVVSCARVHGAASPMRILLFSSNFLVFFLLEIPRNLNEFSLICIKYLIRTIDLESSDPRSFM